jgi:RNA polymerase sigma factor (sigma-70 family)
MARAFSEALTLAADQEFEIMVEAETERLWRLAYSITEDAAEAEDVVQETMERAWRSWGALRRPESRLGWLTRICVNRALDSRRRRGARRRVLDWLRLATQPELDQTAALDLQSLFARLTRHQRAVLVLHYQHGYSLDECGRLMGSRPGTVRSHLARALAGLRESLHDG